MKNSIIEYKKELDKKEKFAKAIVKKGHLVIDTKKFISIDDLLLNNRNYGSYDAVNHLEEILRIIIKHLYNYDVTFDEIRINIIPGFFVNKKDIVIDNNYLDRLTPELVYDYLITIKYNFDVLNQGQESKIFSLYSHIFNTINTNEYLEEINNQETAHIVNFKEFINRMEGFGYQLNIKSFEELLKAQKEGRVPMTSIKFTKEKELTKELKLK